MTPLHPLELAAQDAWPPEQWQEVGVLLAVSGGLDSVALLSVMAANKAGGAGQLTVGHFHHGLRSSADEDQALVESLCRKYDLPLFLGRANIKQQAEAAGDGVEAAARAARYAFLLETAEQTGARYVATAHNADDQAETVLHHIIRGTGLAGLSGMSPARALSGAVTLVRPLLPFRREALAAYAHDLGLEYREDETNFDTRFTRNRLRHDLLPKLRDDYNVNIVESLLRLSGLAGEAQRVIDQQVRELEVNLQTSDNECRINAPALAATEPYLVRELLMHAWRQQGWPLQSLGYEALAELAAMLHADNAAEVEPRVFPGNVLARRDGEQLVLTRRS